jgi:hypothetical protein
MKSPSSVGFGLEYAKLGSRVYTNLEAIQRFGNQHPSPPQANVVEVDRETREALKSLRQRGIIFGRE